MLLDSTVQLFLSVYLIKSNLYFILFFVIARRYILNYIFLIAFSYKIFLYINKSIEIKKKIKK